MSIGLKTEITEMLWIEKKCNPQHLKKGNAILTYQIYMPDLSQLCRNTDLTSYACDSGYIDLFRKIIDFKLQL